MNIAVYTACIGPRSELRERQFSSEHCDFFAFCDPVVDSDTWQVRVAPGGQPTDRRRARWLKVLSNALFPDYDYTIWVDASIQLIKDPTILTRHVELLAGWRHPRRQCIYQEARVCMGQNAELQRPKEHIR